MSRLLKIIVAINLVALAVLTFAYPHWMVGPGKLVPGHRALDTDCFACHAPFTGVASAKCQACHKTADIGRLTSKGLPLTKPLTSVPFHQELRVQDCMACHTDHAGVARYHVKGNFDHSVLKPDTGRQCQSCHRTPGDGLHQKISGNCDQCHSQTRWVPATFAHDKLFALDGDHDVSCVTCHPRNDYSRYTCYGCHEHTVTNIRRQHVEEGIRKFDNCVECHRSANGEGERGGGRGDGREDD